MIMCVIEWLGLKAGLIQAPKKTPKSKASALAARALIPFCNEQFRILLGPTNAVHQAIINAAHHLHGCYCCLSTDAVDWRTRLEQNSKDVAVQYAALQEFHASTKAWVVEPKMHQFLEMANKVARVVSFTYVNVSPRGRMGGCIGTKAGPRCPTR